MKDESPSAFLGLLDRCRAQVEADPSGYTNNPHLYEALALIFLRLCHGNIPEFAVGQVHIGKKATIEAADRINDARKAEP
jgi:hypothetical protein